MPLFYEDGSLSVVLQNWNKNQAVLTSCTHICFIAVWGVSCWVVKGLSQWKKIWQKKSHDIILKCENEQQIHFVCFLFVLFFSISRGLRDWGHTTKTCTMESGRRQALRPVHTKDDNYKYNDKKLFFKSLNLKQFSILKNSRIYTTPGSKKWYTIRYDNTIMTLTVNLKRQAHVQLEKQMILSADVDASYLYSYRYTVSWCADLSTF